ncbi:MAG: L-2-amino-thiazoline-4-carboxylic acid hydrolase [Anaerolineaceae bacterium]|nr:L-2-amino-thiazoline-4-carboxylic acid hydrolase [Anaerolineaceae bacterium]
MITIPSHRKWLRLLSQRYSCQIAESLLLSASQYYQSCLNDNLDQNKRFHPIIRTRVLPVLALYHAMLDHHFDQKTAMHDLELLFVDMYFSVQLQGIRFLNRTLPNPFFVIKPFLRLMIRFSDLPEGQEIQQDTSVCFAIDVHQCFIFDTLRAMNAPELTTVFCASDDRLSAEMNKIEWRRTQTLGRGGEKCDFCWWRK